jgi:hypothetical protein
MPKAKRVRKTVASAKVNSNVKSTSLLGGLDKQKAMIVGGAVAVAGLLASKKGRDLLKVVTGFAAPIAAIVLRKKVTEKVAARI